MIYLRCKYDIISVPSYAKRISSAKQISYPQGISSVTEGNGYHCKKPLLSGRQKRFFTWPTLRGSNSQPSESESDALSSCAKGGYEVPKKIGTYLKFYSVNEGIMIGINHKS